MTKEFEKFQDVRILKGKWAGSIGFIDKKSFNWNLFAKKKKEPKYNVWVRKVKTKSGYIPAFSTGMGSLGGVVHNIPASQLKLTKGAEVTKLNNEMRETMDKIMNKKFRGF